MFSACDTGVGTVTRPAVHAPPLAELNPACNMSVLYQGFEMHPRLKSCCVQLVRNTQAETFLPDHSHPWYLLTSA